MASPGMDAWGCGSLEGMAEDCAGSDPDTIDVVLQPSPARRARIIQEGQRLDTALCC